MFQIVKTINGWFHRYNNGAKSVNISDFEVTLDEVANTFVIVQRNGSNIPLNKLSVNEIEVIDETDESLVETFTNVIDLKARLMVLGYTAYLGAGNADSITGLIQQGTNVTITGSGTLTDPYIINSIGGGGGSVSANDVTETATRVFVTPTEKTAITHSNRSILDGITESFTTALKNAYDNAVTWITNNGTNVLNHIASTSNPHSVTKAQVGLSNVDNTSDVNKPISNATQTALNLKANLTQVGNLLREEFTFTSSQTFTLSNNYGQVYSVEVQGQGALSTSQYTLVAPNQITINDTLDSGDYIVVIYSNAIAGIQPYYSQAEVDALLNLKQNNLGYTPENVANKSTDIITDQASNIKYPTVKTVFDWVIGLGYQTASQVSFAISSALATFKTANFLDATSSIQTQLNNKQNNFYSLKVTTPSAYVTGTLSETEVLRVEIPANTFSANDILKIPTCDFNKIGANGTWQTRIKLTTSPTMPTGATGTIALSPLNGATTLYGNFTRTFKINGGNLKGYSFISGSFLDTNTALNVSSVSFDHTVTQYLYVSVTLSNIADQVRLEGLQLTNY